MAQPSFQLLHAASIAALTLGLMAVLLAAAVHKLRRQLQASRAELEQGIALRTAQLQEANTQLSGEIAVHREAAQALARSETRLQEIISMLPLALFLKTADSQIVLMNQACEQQWGIGLQELTARTEEFYYSAEQLRGFREEDRQAFAQRRVIVRETCCGTTACSNTGGC